MSEAVPYSHATLAYALLAIVLSIIASYLLTRRQHYPFPVVNAYPLDFTQKKAHSAYEVNASELIKNGLAQHKGPITISTPNGPKIILPSSLMEWVKASKDLDHVELVKDDFLSGYSGFEAQTALHEPSHLLVNVIKTKLSKNEAILPIVNAHLTQALEQFWGDDESWHAIDWQKDTTGLISRAAASVFVGPQLAKNQEWQEVTISYVMNYFAALGQLRQWPAFLWPVAHLFNPFSRSCRQLMKRARSMVQEELSRRENEKNDSGAVAIYNDAIEWIKAIAGDRIVDHGALQLGLAVAALYTTSEALRQTILELCKNPEIVPALQNEIQTATEQFGWTKSALFKMSLLDSVMKESQRTLPAYVSLERKAVRDTKLPNGVTIPRGWHIAVDSSLMWSSDIYTNPGNFNGRRYLELREESGNPTHVFTASSKEHTTFGMGRSMCPGRFFADDELKLCLAQVLTKYDFRLQEGYTSSSMYFGFYPVVDPMAKIEVRRAKR